MKGQKLRLSPAWRHGHGKWAGDPVEGRLTRSRVNDEVALLAAPDSGFAFV
jgi:hypothetical protein